MLSACVEFRKTAQGSNDLSTLPLNFFLTAFFFLFQMWEISPTSKMAQYCKKKGTFTVAAAW